MSPLFPELFPERIHIGLGNSYVALAYVKGKKVRAWRMQQFDMSQSDTEGQSGPAARSQSAAIKTIDGWMTELAPRGAHVVAVLSVELVLLHLLPWRNDASSGRQQSLLAQSHFRHVNERFSPLWKTSIAATGYGAPWVASAVNGEVLQDLGHVVARHGAKLVRAAPLAITLFNRSPKQAVRSGRWLLVIEPTMLVMLYVAEGQWRLLKAVPLNVLGGESVAQFMAREAGLAMLPDAAVPIYLMNGSVGDDETGTMATMGGVSHIPVDAGWQAADQASQNQPLYLLGGAP